MKSAFTRTGKRDMWGLLDDGAKSLTRYYLNNYEDGHKQDALDLVTGNYVVVPGARRRHAGCIVLIDARAAAHSLADLALPCWQANRRAFSGKARLPCRCWRPRPWCCWQLSTCSL